MNITCGSLVGRVLLPIFAVCLALQGFAARAHGLPDFTELAHRLSPAVVNISTSAKRDDAPPQVPGLPPGFSIPNLPDDSPLNDFFRHFFEDQGPGDSAPRASLGSGFVVDPAGYIISNYHVIKDADEVVVRLSDRRELPAKVVGSDPRSDIAVLKIETKQPLQALTLGSSEKLQVGEWVLAIGSPFGFDHSVTAGIVSAKGRSLPNENYVPFIQTDVAINPGNSGGPLFNLRGDVVGVNSQIYSRTGGFMGVSFAIPIDVVMDVYRQIRDKGTVSRGWLGVLIQDVTAELAESFQMKKPGGALVSRVLPGSPAENAGIKAGDVITRFDGRTIGTSTDLPPMVGTTKAGQKVTAEIIREGKVRKVTLIIAELPDEAMAEAAQSEQSPASGSEDARLKITVREPTAKERKALSLNGKGVLVERVGQGPGREAGLRPGDLILQLNFTETPTVAAFKAASRALKAGEKVPFLVNREGNPLFLALQIPPAQ